MFKPEKRIVRLLQNIDPGLSLAWNGRVDRWEIFAQRKQLRPSERMKWEPICSFYLNGQFTRISAPKPIDRFHIFFWQGPNGEHRDISTNIVDEVQARDMWQKRAKDIWTELEDEDAEKKKLELRRTQSYHQALATEHPHLRRTHQDIVRNGRHHWTKHFPINYRVGGPFKAKKQKVGT
jgi:hypothetical protein